MIRSSCLLLAVAISAPCLKAADGDSIDSVVRSVYDVISGPPGPRNWDRFRSLFAEGARMIPMRKTSAGGMAPVVLTPEQFIERVSANAAKEGFFEHEIGRRVDSFGDIAHVFSAYESRRAPEEKPFTRGINSFQLVRSGGSWRVVTILWDSEREGNAIPDRYLKPSGD